MAGVIMALTCAALIAGCGGTSDTEKVEQTVESYLTALADGDGQTACDELSGDGQRDLIAMANSQLPEFGTLDCAAVVEQLNGSMGPDEEALLREAKITEVQIEGDIATAMIEGATVSPELVRFDDRWLISSGFGG